MLLALRIPLRTTPSAIPRFSAISLRLTTPFHPLSPRPPIRLFTYLRPLLNTGVPKAGSDAAIAAKHAQYLFPARIPIYHVGSGRFAYVAVLKITVLVLAAFFTGIGVPAYLTSDEPGHNIIALKLAIYSITPIFVVNYITTPLVAFLHIHLPPAARLSRATLTQYIRHLPPTAQIDITTLSPIAKPRTTTIEARALRLAVPPKRFGIVDYVRTEADVVRENRERKWWMFRAVKDLAISGRNQGVKEGWIWDELKERLERVAIREGTKEKWYD